MRNIKKNTECAVYVNGKEYVVSMWKDSSGYSYSVKGLLTVFGWSAGDQEEALREAKSHIASNTTVQKD